MITLREYQESDRGIIRDWPPYPADCQNLDYALRDGGWIDMYQGRPGTRFLVAEDDGTVAGFSLLIEEADGVLEFLIAVHPGRIGQGLGKVIAEKTLALGFSYPGIRTIRLIVRKNNPRAKRLYGVLGFRDTGECIKEVQGIPVPFYCMELEKAVFEKRR